MKRVESKLSNTRSNRSR